MNKTKINITKIITEFTNFVKKYKNNSPRNCQINAIKALFNKHNPKFLFNLCCGAGKTIIESFLVYKEIKDCEDKGEKARVMIASHRLLLNNQLVKIVNSALKSNNIDNVEWWSLSSNVSFDIGNSEHINASKFTKNCLEYIKSSDKHVIIIACAASEKKHFKEIDSDTMENILNDELKTLNVTKFLNLIVQDEIHKDIPSKVLKNFEKIADKIYGFTATPNNSNKKWFGDNNCFEYLFNEALNDGITVKGKLFICKTLAKKLEKCEASSIIHCFEHLNTKCKSMKMPAVFLNYFSSVDNLIKYEKTIIEKYSDKVDVAVFASYKEIKDEKTGTKNIIQCELNGKKITKEELLVYCQTGRDVNKPLIILSAFMIVEGIDIPAINGVGIWCEKNDANMFQAACRGCRTDKNFPNKTHFYIYTSEYLASESKDFLEKLYNGFNHQLDFGDGQEDCTGTGKSIKTNIKNSQDSYLIVGANSIKTVNCLINEITLNYENIIDYIVMNSK